MQEGPIERQLIELTHELSQLQGVCFDSARVALEGSYQDEISAYRARRVWIETLKQSFLLDREQDFSTRVELSPDGKKYILTCLFTSACARYAFWRLTNHQAPEAQYVIETAHIPNTEEKRDEFIQAPDLRSIEDSLLLLGDPVVHPLHKKLNFSIRRWFRRALTKLKTMRR